MGNLTDLELRKWLKAGHPIAGKSDGGGLTFTLSKAGNASWVLRYRIGGKAKEITLGRYPDLSLAKARELATSHRVNINQVIDVAAVKQQKIIETKHKASFSELADLWLDHAVRSKHKHPQVTERVFKRDLLPALGKRDPATITTGEITRLLAKIVSSGRPTIANDALRYLKAAFSYGEVLGVVDRNPAEKIRVQHAGGVEKSRDRVLTRRELVKLFNAIRLAGNKFGRDNELAVLLLLTLGCRKMELFAAKWEEFDLANCLWQIPASRVKTGEARELPLPAPALDWLMELQIRACGSEYVFPARRTSKRFGHVSPDTTWRALQALDHGLVQFTVHDLRRSSRSLMSELGVPFDVAEKILGHKLPGVAAIYDRGNSFQQQKIALERLADVIKGLTDGSPDENILSFARRR